MQNGKRIIVIGLSHKTASVEIREKYQINRKEIPDCLNILKSADFVEGVLLLSTCNRLEFYFFAEKEADLIGLIKQMYHQKFGINVTNTDEYFYKYQDNDAINHLFRVISGLESLVFGEYQIQGQLKEAYSLACQEKSLEKVLHKLFHAAFRAGKKVRSSTSIGSARQSVSGIASEIMIKKLPKDSVITIIGVNENTKILTKSLKKAGFHRFIFANRTIYKAQMLADEIGGRATDLTDIEKNLFESDGVFTSTGANGAIVSAAIIDKLCIQQRCPKLIVDMAVPRDIEAKHAEQIEYFDLNTLQQYLNEEQAGQFKDSSSAEKIIANEAQVFISWTEKQSDSLLEPYSEKFEIIRQQLIEENKEQFSENNLDRVDKLTRSLVHRMQSVFMRILIKNQS